MKVIFFVFLSLLSTSPTYGDSDEPEVCADDANYKFKFNDKKKSCIWVGETQRRKEIWCPRGKGNVVNGRKIVNACSVTCAKCCNDDEEFTFSNNKGEKKKCRWLNKGDPQKRKKRFCKKEEDGETVRDFCPKACYGKCTLN